MAKKRKDLVNHRDTRGNNYFRVPTNLKKTDIDPILKGMVLYKNTAGHL